MDLLQRSLRLKDALRRSFEGEALEPTWIRRRANSFELNVFQLSVIKQRSGQKIFCDTQPPMVTA